MKKAPGWNVAPLTNLLPAMLLVACVSSLTAAIILICISQVSRVAGLAVALSAVASCIALMCGKPTGPPMVAEGLAHPVPAHPAADPSPRPQKRGSDHAAWLSLVEECVDLFDELDRHRADLDPAQRELTDHVMSRLQELLERSGVQSIEGDRDFDPARHQAANGLAEVPSRIAETLSPGFLIGKRILRRSRVLLS